MSGKRQTPKIYEITMPSSGITLQYKKVSQYVVDDIRKQRASNAPQPPLEEVETADGKKSMLPNKDNPEYAQALEDYTTETNLLVMDAFIRLGVVLDVNDPEIDQQISDEREALSAIGVQRSTDDKKLFYIRYIACVADEIGDLAGAIAQRSEPTANAVEAAKS